MMGTGTEPDLSGDTDTAPAPWIWSIDPSTVAEAGYLQVSTSQWQDGAMSTLRTLSLDAPDFTIEAATAVGEDLDGDDIPELLVELWGEGQHEAWLVPSATDKSARVLPRQLKLHSSDQLGHGVRMTGDGSRAVASSGFRLSGSDTLVNVYGVFEGQGLSTGHRPRSVAEMAETWAIADVLSADTSVVKSGTVSLSGANRLPLRRWTHVAISHEGRLLAPSSSNAWTSRLELGGGDGGSVRTMAPGDIATLAVDPSTGGLIVTAGLTTAPLTLHRVPGRDGGPPHTVARVAGAEGAQITVDGDVVMNTKADASIAVALGDAGVAVFGFSSMTTGDLVDDSNTAIRVEAVIDISYDTAFGQRVLPPATTTNGSTLPVLLSRELADDGGVLLGWRDGDGQAWMGVVDVPTATSGDDTELPFLQGPVAVGAPLNDPDDVLGVTSGALGMVAPGRRIIADTPFLSMEDLEERFESWDEPMDVPFAGYDRALAHGPVVLTVGGDRPQTVLLKAFADLEEAELVVLATAAAESLPVPRLSASLLPDAPPVLVSTTAKGDVVLDFVDGTQHLARTVAPVHLAETDVPNWVAISAADINGDALTDVIFDGPEGATILLSDGLGGTLDTTSMPASTRTNFALLLDGGSHSRECAVSSTGGTDTAPGRARLVGRTVE